MEMGNLHEGFVEVADLLNVNVELGVDEGLDGAVGAGDGDDGGGVLEVQRRLHFQFAQASVSVTDLHHGR